MANLTFQQAQDVVRNRGRPVNRGVSQGAWNTPMPTDLYGSRTPLNLAINRSLDERNNALNFQQGNIDYVKNLPSPFTYPGVQETLAQYQIGSPFYNTQLRGIENEAASAFFLLVSSEVPMPVK